MNPKIALRTVFSVALFGVLFSGTLTYQELFGSGVVACPASGAPGTIFGYPACVYGLFMYLIILIVSLVGLAKAQ